MKFLIFVFFTLISSSALAKNRIELKTSIATSAAFFNSAIDKSFFYYKKSVVKNLKYTDFKINQPFGFKIDDVKMGSDKALFKKISNPSLGQKIPWTSEKSAKLPHSLVQNTSSNAQDEAAYVDNKALYISYFIPGGGLIYEGQIKKGLISLGINTFLIYAVIQSLIENKYGLALFFIFLETPFYIGNINATKEQIANNTKLDIEQRSLRFKNKKEFISFNYDF